jgi:Tryptophan-associated transmembrane protein (Trp_oprn_chp)
MLSLLLASAGLWGGSRLTWFAEFRDAGVRGVVLYTENGAQRAGALVPLALLALAGMAGMIATGGWARRVLGAVLALAGLAAGWVAVDGVRFSGAGGLPIVQLLIARGLVLLAGILLICGGLAAIKGASVMPRLGARYSAPGAKRVARDPDVELWEALSDGEDPTAGR